MFTVWPRILDTWASARCIQL